MRPRKNGLDYYPLSVDFFNDDCIRAISNEFGIRAEIVTLRTILAIFKRGYYLNWNKAEKIKLLSTLPGISINFLEQVVQRLVKLNFFHAELFETRAILTSTEIQALYFRSTRRRQKGKNLPYLVSVDNNGVSVYNNSVSVDNNGVSVYNNSVSVDNNGVSAYNNSVSVDNNGVSVYNNSVSVYNNSAKTENSPDFSNSINRYNINNNYNNISDIEKKNKEKNKIKKEKEKKTSQATSTTPSKKEEKSCAKKEERWVKLNPPTLEEIISYCQQQNSKIDPQAFLAHYTSIGWVYGKSSHKVVNWKACIATWEARNKTNNNGYRQSQDRTSYRDTTAEYNFSTADF